MKYIILILAVVLTSCGRKRDDVTIMKDKESIEKIKSQVTYDPNSYRNVYLNMKINDVVLATKVEGSTELAEVEVHTIYSDEPLYFSGYFPQGSYSEKLEMVTGSSNLTVELKCLNSECQSLLIAVKELEDQNSVTEKDKPGIYPTLLDNKDGVWVKTWTPEIHRSGHKRDLNNIDLEAQRELEMKRTISLFVNFDDVSSELGMIDQFREVPQLRKASEILIRRCEEGLGGVFSKNTLDSFSKGFWGSLNRFSFNTLEFEYDDFVYGECTISEETKWEELQIYSEGPTYETALKKVIEQCTSKLRGVPSFDYNKEIHRVGNKKANDWIAKIKCSSIKGDKYTRI